VEEIPAMTNHIRAAKEYVPSYGTCYVLYFKAVDKNLRCKHSNESYRAGFLRRIVYYAVQGGSNF